ncbi:MAG TPA: hypothetical protein VI248_04570 [Kineosporiaceae bacterium]
MPTRRSKGDGGLHWDENRKRWIATASLSYDPAGKRIVKRGSGQTKTEAKNELKEIIRDYEDVPTIAPTNYTVDDAIRDWSEYGLSGRDDGTVATNTFLCESTQRRHALLGSRAPTGAPVEDPDLRSGAHVEGLNDKFGAPVVGFRGYLADARIPHFTGGPHPQSLRHGFAVANLRRWAAHGADWR